ncbi:MAG: DUF1573 domain-containing protein [Saprospiraceae bacterium]
MRLLIIICLIASFTLISCDDETTSVTQATEQTQQEVAKSIVETTTESTTEKMMVVETVEKEIEKEIEKQIETTKPKQKSAPQKRPKLSFDKKTFEYGMIEQGDVVNHSFSFTNKGNADLIIKDAEASCGCTTPTYPFVPIKPGESGTISVTFNSTGKMGTQRPNITVTSNAYPRVQTLYLEGFVTHQSTVKEEVPTSLIEEDVSVNPEGNTAKGEEPNSENN